MEQKTSKKVKNPNLVTETFKLNKEIDVENAICSLLERSNNKSGLIKDALGMYACLVNELGYASPYIQNNISDWTTILANLNVSGMIGRPAQEVKQEIVQQASISRHQEAITIEDDDFDDEYEDDDNDLDY